MLRIRLPMKLRWPRPRVNARTAVRAGLLTLVAWLAFNVVHIYLGSNAHSVIDTRIWRSAQLSGEQLARMIDAKGIRTVINLRGHCPDFDWYRQEAAVTAARGVSHEDITLSANRLPPPGELKRLLEVLDHAEQPILFHCKQGADRTGLVSALVLLLYTDASLSRARQELWPHRGHFRVSRTVAMDDFLDRYEAWLNGRLHAAPLLRDWMLNQYSAGPAKAEFAWVTPLPDSVPAGKPLAFTLKVTNRSGDDWRFTAGSTSGIHLQYALYDADWTAVVKDQAGLFNRVVKAGESVELLLAFPKLKPGVYALRAEMADFTAAAVAVRAKYFYQFGDPFVQATLVVK